MTLSDTTRVSSGLFRRLLGYCRPYQRWIALALLLILTMSALVNYLPLLIKQIIDSCLLNQEISSQQRLDQLYKFSWIYLVLTLIGYTLRYFQAILTAWLGQKILYDLRVDVYKKIIYLHQKHFDRTPVGAMLTRITSDVERLQGFVTDGIVGSIADLFMLISIMIYMVIINARVALSLFAVLPLIFWALFYVNGKLRQANRQIRVRQSSLNALLQEYLTGMTTIQLFNREPQASEEFRERNRRMRNAYFQEVRWFSAYFPIIEGGQSAAFLLILGVGGFAILNNSSLISIGVLIAFLTYIRNFFRPLGSLSDKAGLFQLAMASAERIFDLLDTVQEVPETSDPLPANNIKGKIEFKHVWFAYQQENWVLKDFSFTIEPAQTIAVVGATGAGKSTIINLIGRFYDVQQGQVLINGIDIRRFRKSDLRKKMGYVFQDPFLFAASAADNISLLNPELSRADIINAARTVNAHGFIEALAHGYDTILNERGAGLSLGQKQLLSMARMLAQNPALLVVLDEATASVDTATEILIQDAMRKLMQNRTSIVIAHRLSTIRHADLILVMRYGELIDSGTHDQLMQRRGYYHQLYELMEHSPH